MEAICHRPRVCRRSAWLLPVMQLMSSQFTNAQEQQAHVHGTAELFIVLDGNQLEIELHSPAMNLLGFEHRANSAEQHAVVDKAKSTLAKAETLFQFQPSTCTLTRHEIDFSSVTKDKDEHKNEHDEHLAHHDKASHERASQEHGEHDSHDEEEHDHEGEARQHSDYSDHSDIEAHYHFQCANPDELRLMTIAIATAFPGVHTLNTQWVINGRQGAITLDQQQRSISFK